MKEKKSVLITGASSGIGKACALYLDNLGFMVFAGVRNQEDKKKLSNEGSERLKPVMLDVEKENTIVDAYNMIANETEYPLFGLVNNAGIGIGGVLEATPTEEIRKVMEVNVIGLHAVTRAFLPLLRKHSGRIINIGSISSFVASPAASTYAASKYAVRAITESLHLELKPFGMFVSLVAPGPVKSAIWGKSKAYRDRLRKNIDPELTSAYSFFVKISDIIDDLINPVPAIEVAKVVAHGLTSKKPKQVYIVGGDAKKTYLLLKLPRRLFNWLMIKHLAFIANKKTR
ncbi:MAG: SDR family oxidoreductase [Bacteroidales bacterium]|nr:SDR family oxidoreductase [Bacteroidales bacterium]